MRTSGRTSAATVPSLAITSTTSCAAGQARHHLLDARIDAARFDIDALEQPHLLGIAQTFERIVRQIELMTGRRMPRLQRTVSRRCARSRAPPATPRSAPAARSRRNTRSRSSRPPAHARRRPARCCALPSFTMLSSSDQDSSRTQLEIQVSVVDAVAHDAAEHARDAVLVEPRRRQDRVARELERLIATAAAAGRFDVERLAACGCDIRRDRSRRRGYGSLVTWNFRCDSAGKRPRSSCCNVRSISATARPGPASATRATTWPHGSTIIESP